MQRDDARLFRGRAGAIRAYAAAVAISIVAAIWLLQLPKADLRVPFDYRGDALVYQTLIKGVVEHGWFWTNPNLGAPAELQLYDFPVAAHESLHLLAIKILSAFSGDWALLTNVYFLLGFPLITLSAMAVFRQFGVSYGSAIVGSVLYAFLPSRLLKGEAHLFLDVFWQVPLAILVVLWVCSENPPLVRPGSDARGPATHHQCRARNIVAVLVCAVSACTSLYYSFFTICLLLAGGAWAAIERRSIRNAVAAVALAAVIVAGLVANGLPAIVHHWRQGPNDSVGLRGSAEAEIFGMKITQLLLPVDGHRFPPLRRLAQRYAQSAPLVNENSTTSLGLVGGIGFLALIAAALIRRRSDRACDDLGPSLAKLNLCAVLLGTVGGFGSLFALVVTPQIRTYSRLNVFVGFFSLFAVVLLLDGLKRLRPRLLQAALPAILIVGLFDQVTPLAVRPYAAMKELFASDRDLVHHMESVVSPGAAIFVLPYVTFPESVLVNNLGAYDLLRPTLHSSSLRWSFPTILGRSNDLVLRQLSQREPDQLLDVLPAAGFAGILIGRDGYPDNGAAVEAAFRAALGTEPRVSHDGRLSFFNLSDDHRPGRVRPSEAEIERMLHPLQVSFADGIYGMEQGPMGPFHWSKSRGAIHVYNDAEKPRRVSLRMTLAAGRPPARITISGDLMSDQIEVDAPVTVARTIDLPPGHHVIRFHCDGRQVYAPPDLRDLVWRVENFTFDELTESRP